MRCSRSQFIQLFLLATPAISACPQYAIHSQTPTEMFATACANLACHKETQSAEYVERTVGLGDRVERGILIFVYPGSAVTFRNMQDPNAPEITYQCAHNEDRVGVVFAYVVELTAIEGRVTIIVEE